VTKAARPDNQRRTCVYDLTPVAATTERKVVGPPLRQHTDIQFRRTPNRQTDGQTGPGPVLGLGLGRLAGVWSVVTVGVACK